MSGEFEEEEPETLPEEIVHWQPSHRALTVTHGAVAEGASATGSAVIALLALGAFAVGALAIGALAVGRLRVGNARFKRLTIDDLEILKLRLPERH